MDTVIDRIQTVANSKSKTFLVSCLSFLLGVAALSVYNEPIKTVYILFFCYFFIFGVIAVWSHAFPRLFLLALLFFGFGIARYNFSFPPRDDISSLSGETVTIEGFVAGHPDVRIDGVRYVIRTPRGRILVKNHLYPRYRYGDILRLQCDLRRPTPIDIDGQTFRYDLYLARFGIYATCQYPMVETLGVEPNTTMFQWIFSLKEKIHVRVTDLWPEPFASFMAGLLYGYRGGLGELEQTFIDAGIIHIVAISGFNIALIVSAFLAIGPYFRVRRQHMFFIVTMLLFIFVIFTGASASVIRAAVMGFLVLLSKQVGRLSRPLNLIVFAAGVMVLANPRILFWDIGFQLSFASLFGILYISPRLAHIARHIPDIFGFKETALLTVSATLSTLPFILFYFGRVSFVAPIVNVLVLWIIPWLMAFGFTAIVTSFLWFPVGQVFAWIAWVGMRYSVWIATLFT